MVRVLSVGMGFEEAGFSTSSASSPTSVEMTLFLIEEAERSVVTMSVVMMSVVMMFWGTGACVLVASACVVSCCDLVRVVRSGSTAAKEVKS